MNCKIYADKSLISTHGVVKIANIVATEDTLDRKDS